MDIVRIKWCKTKFVPGEASIEECKEEHYEELESLGFLISRDAKKVIIAHEKIATDFCDISIIPTGCIIDLSYLSVASSPV